MESNKHPIEDSTRFKSGAWTGSRADPDEENQPAEPRRSGLIDGGMQVRTPLGQPPKRRKRKKRSAVKTLTPRARQRSPYGFFERCYRLTYYIGVQVMRTDLRIRRWLRRFFDIIKRASSFKRQQHRYKRQKRVDRVVRAFHAPFRDLRRQWAEFCETVAEARQISRWRAVKAVFSTAGRLLRSGWKAIGMILSYVAPAAALILLVSVATHYANITLALSVNYAGQQVGYIEDETVFVEAENAMKERIINEEYVSPENPIPTFTLTIADGEHLTDVDTLTDRLISASGNILEEADGLYIDDKFIGATTEGAALLDYMSSTLDKHATGAQDETIGFIKKIELRPGIYPVSSVLPIFDIVSTISSDVEEERVYVVQAGDTPTGIASQFDVPYSEIKALNPTIEDYSFFKVGAEVLISQAVPYLGVQVIRTEIYETDVAFGYDDTNDNTLPEGYVQTTSSGTKGIDEVVAHVTYIDDIEVARTIISTTRMKEPINAKRLVGTKKPLVNISGNAYNASGFIWPVDSGVFNGSLGSYWGHTGMDISNNFLSGVRAAKGGVVVYSAYYGMYGNHIIIDHGDGVQTLYAHLNDRYVGVGTVVNQGDLIGRVGRTGNVTGPHLHFEVRINGRYMDPINYIGTYKR